MYQLFFFCSQYSLNYHILCLCSLNILVSLSARACKYRTRCSRQTYDKEDLPFFFCSLLAGNPSFEFSLLIPTPIFPTPCLPPAMAIWARVPRTCSEKATTSDSSSSTSRPRPTPGSSSRLRDLPTPTPERWPEPWRPSTSEYAEPFLIARGGEEIWFMRSTLLFPSNPRSIQVYFISAYEYHCVGSSPSIESLLARNSKQKLHCCNPTQSTTFAR